MIVLYIVILIYFNFNITSIVNVFMLSIEKKNKTAEVVARRCSVKKLLLKICKLHRKTPVPESLFLIKLQASGNFLYRTPPVVASETAKSGAEK